MSCTKTGNQTGLEMPAVQLCAHSMSRFHSKHKDSGTACQTLARQISMNMAMVMKQASCLLCHQPAPEQVLSR